MSEITKLTVDYNINGKNCRIVYDSEHGLKNIEIPVFDDNPKLTFYSDEDKKFFIDYKKYLSLKNNEIVEPSQDDKECIELLLDMGKEKHYGFTINEMHDLAVDLPSVSYFDATENILLKLPNLDSEIIDSIDSGGLWSGCGERVLVINTGSYPFDEKEKPEIKLEFTHFDKEMTWAPKPVASVKKKSSTVYLCSVDTNQFSSYLEGKTKVTMKGVFSLRCSRVDEQNVTYELPVSLVINNSKIFDKNNKYLCLDRTSRVAIDFGTSSTCAAVKTNVVSMIEMSPDTEGQSAYSVYENPTNLMIRRWNELSDKWNKIRQPVIRRFNADYSEYSMASFDFSHPVKEQEINDQRVLNSVLTQLKMIPQLIEDGKRIKIRDYEYSEEVDITDEDCGSEAFNPIEFYGYLLGKAINHPNGQGNKYFTKYILSYPVKFSDSIRKKIEASLTRGIIRSLPEPLRDLKNDKGKNVFQLKMKYSEPIACVGAACGEELVIKDDKPVIFGVFDLGGGTADYSFGMYRKADVRSEGRHEALELFGVDGDDNFGGELLISKITYWILVQNCKKVIEKGIVFEKPVDELTQDGFGNLIMNTVGAAANMRKINEKISRPFFEGKYTKATIDSDGDAGETVWKKNETTGRYDYFGSGVTTITELFSLKSESGKDNIELTIDYDMLNKKLKQLISDKCSIFSKSMDNAFSLPDSVSRMEKYEGTVYDKSKVCILMSGNSSRHPFVKECLTEIFKDNEIHLIGSERKENNGNRYKVTPKTAVAVGMLKLEQMLVNEPKDLSIIYVYVESSPDNFERLLDGNMEDHEWKFAGVINDGSITIYTSTNDNEDRKSWNPVSLDFDCDDDENMMCYIRKIGRDSIEYTAVSVGMNPNDDEDDILEINEIKLR